MPTIADICDRLPPFAASDCQRAKNHQHPCPARASAAAEASAVGSSQVKAPLCPATPFLPSIWSMSSIWSISGPPYSTPLRPQKPSKMPAIADICDPLPPLAANRQPRKQPPARLSRQRLGDGGSLGDDAAIQAQPTRLFFVPFVPSRPFHKYWLSLYFHPFQLYLR